jgi:hypothetical protein
MAVYSTLAAAGLRALCVVALITLPSLLLPVQSQDGLQVVALVAIFAAIFTVVEYTVASPSFIEFRSAPPFNRLRFIALFTTVLMLSLIMRGNEAPSTLTRLMQLMGERIGGFPFLARAPDGADDAGRHRQPRSLSDLDLGRAGIPCVAAVYCNLWRAVAVPSLATA